MSARAGVRRAGGALLLLLALASVAAAQPASAPGDSTAAVDHGAAAAAAAASDSSAGPGASAPGVPAVVPPPPGAAVAPTGAAGPPQASPVLVDRVIAVVDEEPILLSDLEREIESYKFEAESSGQKIDKDDATLRHELLERLIEIKLLVAQAKLDGITLGDDELEAAVNRSMDDMIARFGSRRSLDRELERSGMTYGDLEARNRELIRNRLYTSRIVSTHIRPLVEVREDEVRRFYEAHKDQVPKSPAKVKLANILVVPQPSAAAQEQIQAKLAQIQAELARGTSFEDVAKQYSEDASAPGGGHLGSFGKGDLFNGLLEDAAWAQPVGAVGAPITTEIGVHLLRVDARTESEVTLSQIMLRLTITDEERNRARERAGEVSRLAREGRDFAELAKNYSDDPTSRDKGGELGEFALDKLTPAFRDALRDKAVGDVTDPVQGAAGFFVLKLVARADATSPSYEDVSKQLHDMVEEEKIQTELKKFLVGLRSKFYIDVKS